MPDLAIVPPAEWKRRTAVLLRSRGDQLIAIDAAYETYYRDRSPANAQNLYWWLEQYLTQHGRRWARIDRNTKSGGLMEWVHTFTRSQAGQATQEALLRAAARGQPLPPRPAIVTRNPAEAALQAAAMNARLGVLYLFAHTDIQTQHFKILLEGSLSITGAAAAFVPHAGEIASIPSVGVGQHAIAPQQFFGTELIGPGARGVAAGVGWLQGAQAARGVNPLIFQPVTTPKPGKLVRQGGQSNLLPHSAPAQRPDDSRFAAAAAMAVAVPGYISVEQVIATGETLYQAGKYVAKLGRELIEALVAKLKEFADWIWAKINWTRNRATLQSAKLAVAGRIIAEIVKAAVGHIAKEVAPFVGAGLDLAGGIAKTITAAKQRIEVALLRRKFDVQVGHPEALANAIEEAMNWAIGKGLWSALKGATKLGLTFVSAGASVIGNVVAAGLEFIVKALLRLREASLISGVLEEARNLYRDCAEPETDPETHRPRMRPKAGSLVAQRETFTKVYEAWCDVSPCIPMLTLNTGICGDLMQMMKMFDDTARAAVVTTDQVAAGAEYFRQLKIFGREYLRQSGFQFLSSNDQVRGLLAHAVTHHERPSLTTAEQLLTVAGAL